MKPARLEHCDGEIEAASCLRVAKGSDNQFTQCIHMFVRPLLAVSWYKVIAAADCLGVTPHHELSHQTRIYPVSGFP